MQKGYIPYGHWTVVGKKRKQLSLFIHNHFFCGQLTLKWRREIKRNDKKEWLNVIYHLAHYTLLLSKLAQQLIAFDITLIVSKMVGISRLMSNRNKHSCHPVNINHEERRPKRFQWLPAMVWLFSAWRANERGNEVHSFLFVFRVGRAIDLVNWNRQLIFSFLSKRKDPSRGRESKDKRLFSWWFASWYPR